MRNGFAPPRMRVMVHPDAAPFHREGKNVFCGFVQDADEDIVPGDEVLVVDPDDRLLAVGRAMLVKSEMLAMKKGLAVKVRDGIKL